MDSGILSKIIGSLSLIVFSKAVEREDKHPEGLIVFSENGEWNGRIEDETK